MVNSPLILGGKLEVIFVLNQSSWRRNPAPLSDGSGYGSDWVVL
jgi:hypothetical protein